MGGGGVNIFKHTGLIMVTSKCFIPIHHGLHLPQHSNRIVQLALDALRQECMVRLDSYGEQHRLGRGDCRFNWWGKVAFIHTDARDVASILSVEVDSWRGGFVWAAADFDDDFSTL